VRLSHGDARQVVHEAFRRVFERAPTRSEAQCVQAVGWLETGYGQHWRPPGDRSNNWGAIQAHAGWTGPIFSYTDTRPNEDGTSTPYEQAFRAYRSAAKGATDLVRVVFTGGRNPVLGSHVRFDDPLGARHVLALPAATRGDTYAFSGALYDTVYYQGFGRDRSERVEHHHAAVLNACAAMARELREPMPNGDEPPAVVRVLREGATGNAVRIVQGIVGVKQDGAFGPQTRVAVQAWQRARRLRTDGVWGPVCYRIACTELPGETLDALDGYVTEAP
jgi:peptidoglycan hydrolase-like protein with peptidoglycan-binding domain